MPRKREGRPTPHTHFQQIPVKVVQKIATRRQVPDTNRVRTDLPIGEPAPRKTRDADAGHFHGVQFYNDPDALCRIVGGFIGEGLEHGTLAVLIVTPDHADRIESCLRRRGIDVDAVKRLRQLVSFDARETLQLFMADGMPNPSAFRRTVGGILTHVRREREHCEIRAYGEMVDVLWKDGREAAAIRLETLWNQLASTHDFELLCGYSMGNFYKGAGIDEVKAQHTHVGVDRPASATTA